MLKKKIATLLGGIILVSTLGSTALAYTVGPNGDLNFSGGQTGTKIYSEIARKSGRRTNYGVQAIVKVGGNTYRSGFKTNYAYKNANRVWYRNETAHYEYYKK